MAELHNQTLTVVPFRHLNISTIPSAPYSPSTVLLVSAPVRIISFDKLLPITEYEGSKILQSQKHFN